MEALRLMGALLAVAGIFYLAWLVPRVIAKRHGPGSLGGRHLQVVEKVPLGKESKLVLVQAGGKLMLLGVTPGGVTHLCDLDSALVQKPGDAPEIRPFSELFREAVAESLPKGRIRDSFDKVLGCQTGKEEKAQKPDC